MRLRSFLFLASADFLVRSAYQMGKTPLLPIFAAALGASDVYLGFIVSVSTVTGMVLKPFIGLLSDRWGRRIWLLIGTAFFALTPFFYRFISTPEQLAMIRLVHGLATAIYGPVTLAYVIQGTESRLAERVGWFSNARTLGYIVGPAVAGWLLLSFSPVTVFTLIGIVSSLAFVPLVLLPEPKSGRRPEREPLAESVGRAFIRCGRSKPVWLTGVLEAAMYMATYAVKAFLPVYALADGVSVALVGSFFALQEGIHILGKPWGGRLGDCIGYLRSISLGMAALGSGLLILSVAQTDLVLMIPAILLGITQALVVPSTVALVSERVEQEALGTSMGFVGSLRNAGKVAGPVGAGFLLKYFDFAATFQLLGIAALTASILIPIMARLNQGRTGARIYSSLILNLTSRNVRPLERRNVR